MKRFLPFLAAAAGSTSPLVNTSGIADVSTLRRVDKPAKVTAPGSLDSVKITKHRVILILRGGGFEATAVADRRVLEALYGPVTPKSFESAVVVRGLYMPTNQTLESVLRGCRSAVR